MAESYEIGNPIIKKPISYAYWEFKSFTVREVMLNNNPTGEYHLKINNKDGIISGDTYNIFMSELSNPEIGQIDKSKILNLEYPYYIKIENELIKENVNEIFHDINDKIERKVS
jgi:hypothetical protein